MKVIFPYELYQPVFVDNLTFLLFVNHFAIFSGSSIMFKVGLNLTFFISFLFKNYVTKIRYKFAAKFIKCSRRLRMRNF
jgi:hypothetical protein